MLPLTSSKGAVIPTDSGFRLLPDSLLHFFNGAASFSDGASLLSAFAFGFAFISLSARSVLLRDQSDNGLAFAPSESEPTRAGVWIGTGIELAPSRIALSKSASLYCSSTA